MSQQVKLKLQNIWGPSSGDQQAISLWKIFELIQKPSIFQSEMDISNSAVKAGHVKAHKLLRRLPVPGHH